MSNAVSKSMRRLLRSAVATMLASTLTGVPMLAHATEPLVGPEALIGRISSAMLDALRSDPELRAGDLPKLTALVDARVMHHVDFARMTASAVGHHWRGATRAQRDQLQVEFKSLLLRAYAGALALVSDQRIEVRPRDAMPDETSVVVRSVVRGGGNDPIRLDYRLALSAGAWKIYDVNVLGVWMALNYRNAFAQEISEHGIDGLIAALVRRREGR